MSLSNVKSVIDFRYNQLAVRYARLLYSHRDINSHDYTRKSLTESQRREISNFWKPFCKFGRDSWKWFEFYNSITSQPEFLKYYIPEGIYYSRIDSFLSQVKDCEAIDDKNLYDLLFHNVYQPTTICRKQGGIFLDADYNIITADNAKLLVHRAGNAIIKPSRDSCSGYGIAFFDTGQSDSELDAMFKAESFVVQQVLRQHKVLADIHPQSLNTIRIITLLLNGEVVPLSSVLRIGTGDSRVDNAHSGGIVCGITARGILKPTAYNLYGLRFDKNPTNGQPFDSVQIPSYESCISLVCRLAPRLVEFTRLVSWDLSVDESGVPILIEANLTYGGVDVHQVANGPIFGAETENILNEVFKNKR